MTNLSYDDIVRAFLEDDQGIIIHISDDGSFTRALRNILSRVIGFKGDILFSYISTQQALQKCTQLRDERTPTLVFIERMLGDVPSTDFLMTLHNECPDAIIIMLAWEATQETVAYFFELGVSRVIIKPTSADKVIQEMALAVNPPGDLKRQMTRCRELLRKQFFYEALDVSDRILLLKPDSARGLAMRGDALMGIGEVDKAVQSYMTAHESKPIFMAPLLRLAAAFRDMEDERALAYLMRLDEISPLNPERKVDIAEQYILREDHAEAEVYLDQSVEVAEREALSMVGDLTMRIVDAVSGVAPDLAIKYLYRVIDNKRLLSLDDLILFNRLGMILRGEGRWEDAVDIYGIALTINQKDPVIHYNMGLAYWEGSERTKALKCFEKALAADSEFYKGSVGASLNIGLLYLDMRMYHDAEKFFRHVLEIDPRNSTANKRLRIVKKRLAA